MAKLNNPAIGNYAVETLAPGEYVQRVNKAGEPMKKVYQLGKFDRSTRKYELNDTDDISRAIYVRKGTKLHAGFTY